MILNWGCWFIFNGWLGLGGFLCLRFQIHLPLGTFIFAFRLCLLQFSKWVFLLRFFGFSAHFGATGFRHIHGQFTCWFCLHSFLGGRVLLHSLNEQSIEVDGVSPAKFLLTKDGTISDSDADNLHDCVVLPQKLVLVVRQILLLSFDDVHIDDVHPMHLPLIIFQGQVSPFAGVRLILQTETGDVCNAGLYSAVLGCRFKRNSLLLLNRHFLTKCVLNHGRAHVSICFVESVD